MHSLILYKIAGVALTMASLEIPLGVWMAKRFFNTVPLPSTLIQGLLATEVVDYGIIAAISLFYMLPPLFLFIFLQKALMKAPIMGGKGMV